MTICTTCSGSLTAAMLTPLNAIMNPNTVPSRPRSTSFTDIQEAISGFFGTTANPIRNAMKINTTNAETDADVMDFCSNGVKLRSTDGGVNYSGRTYIYAAFAEAPFVNSEGVPCNAR